MLHELASDINKLKRRLSTFLLVIKVSENVWQAISYRMIFEAGSHPPIHGKITTSHANLGTTEPRIGSFKARRSLNGNCPDQVPFFGSTVNVSCRPTFALSWRTDDLAFRSGCRQECP